MSKPYSLYPVRPIENLREMIHTSVSLYGDKAAFAQRRKTLLNCLGTGFGGQLNKDQLKECMESCGISPSARGETLDIQAFAALTNAIAKAMEN